MPTGVTKLDPETIGALRAAIEVTNLYRSSESPDEAHGSPILVTRLRAMLKTDEPGMVVEANAAVRECDARPRLRHAGEAWVLEVVTADPSGPDQVVAATGMAIMNLIQSGQLSRLRVCTAPGCEALMLDLSRNRSKMFCSRSCGNRIAVASYRGRRSDAEKSGD